MFFKFQKNFKLLLLTGLLAFGGAWGSDFNIGTAGVRGMSVEKENELGQYFMIVARSQLPIVNDPVLSEYLAGTVGRMAAQAQGVRYPFESFFVEDRSVNAAAFFGGKIMVNTGLIAATDTESEFAGVLAHEMTHVTQRHLARSLEIQSDAQTAGILGMIGGLILGVVNPALAMATVTASVNGAQQAGINYTRSNEEEADRIGIDLLYRAGFNPEGMPSLFRKLRAMDNKINPAFEMLLTHPLSEKRVADAENRSRQFKKNKYFESTDYQFAKSRILARYSGISREHLKSEAERRVKVNPEDYGAWYLLALTATDGGDFSAARQALDVLNRKFSANLFIIDTMTDYLTGSGKAAQAVEMLESQLRKHPDNEVVAVNLAQSYLESGKTDSAIQILRRLNRSKESVVGKELLMKAYRIKKDTCSMYQLNAELMSYRGRWEQAQMNANTALRVCKNKNDVMRTRALISKIVKDQAVYKELMK